MTEAEFERRIGTQAAQAEMISSIESSDSVEIESAPRSRLVGFLTAASRTGRADQSRRVQRMFALEGRTWTETLVCSPSTWGRTDRGRRRLCDYHRGRDGAFDSRDRRGSPSIETSPERSVDAEGITQRSMSRFDFRNSSRAALSAHPLSFDTRVLRGTEVYHVRPTGQPGPRLRQQPRSRCIGLGQLVPCRAENAGLPCFVAALGLNLFSGFLFCLMRLLEV
jgi:hypothetical protein